MLRPCRSEDGLPPETERLEKFLVALVIGAIEVLEKLAALGDHDDQSATGVMVLLVKLEMLREVEDLLGQTCDLHVGAPRVLLVKGEFGEIDFSGAHAAG